MNLLIDVGNTRVKYCFSNQETLSEVKYGQVTDIKEIINHQRLEQILLVAVSNQKFCEQVQVWAKSNNVPCQQLHSQASSFSITNSYENHSKMGADRWLAVLGAERLFPKMNLLIVDSGTATTFDILDATKQHRGGWIIPGVELMMNSLFQSTDKVMGEAGKIAQLGFGHNTDDNVNMGCWATTTAAIHGALAMNKNSGISIDKLILTGGNASELNRLGHFRAELVDNLVFEGMQRFVVSP